MGCQVCLGPNYCAIFQSVVLQALMRAVNSINHSHEAVPLVNVEKWVKPANSSRNTTLV